MANKRKKQRKVKNPYFKLELLIVIITILFSLFGFILISYNGNINNLITGLTSFSVYPDESFGTSPIEENLTNKTLSNKTYSLPIIENETLPLESSEEQFGILPIENLSTQVGEDAGFSIQPIENLSTQVGEDAQFGILPIEENITKLSYDIEVFANGGRYMCESNQIYGKCIKDDGKEAYYGELS